MFRSISVMWLMGLCLLLQSGLSAAQSTVCNDMVCFIEERDRQFVPNVLQIQAGTTVTWQLGSLNPATVSQSDEPFTCTASTGTDFLDSQGSSTYSFQFNTPGAFSYFSPGEDCDVFGMFGQILVVDPEVAAAGGHSDAAGTVWITAGVLVLLPLAIIIISSAATASLHSQGGFEAIRIQERAKRLQKAQAAGEKVWLDDKWGLGASAAAQNVDLSAGGPEDEHAVDQAAYDEFYGRLCVLRHDRNTFAAMLKEMQKRMQKDQVNHDKYSPIVTDLTRLLKLMKNKTAQSNSMPLDGPDLLVWAHGTLERYLEQQAQLKAATAPVGTKKETET